MKKKLITAAITIVIIAILTFLAIKFGGTKETEVEKMSAFRFDSILSTDLQTISNGVVSLEFDTLTTKFTFTDKNGKKWTAVPEEALNGGNDVVKSLLYVEYKNKSGVKNYFNSYEHSVSKGNYTYEVLPDQNTIRIDFSIGLIAKTYYIPTVMSAETMQKYKDMANGLPDADKSKEAFTSLRDWYKELKPEKLKDGDPDEWKKYTELYPDLLEDKHVFVLFDTTKNWQKEKLETIFRDEFGYTMEQYEADLAYGQVEGDDKLLPNINLSLYLRLEDDSLVAEVPFDSVVFYEEYPITQLRILPFMCAGSNTEDGFLFVPDGSGAYINFNNGKITQSTYSAKVYGWDYGQSRSIVISDPVTRFPVYGISYADRDASLLAMIEGGACYASVEGDVAGKVYDYNYVTNVFTLVHDQIADINGRSISAVYMFEKSLPKGEKVSVRFKGVDSSSYVDMAKTYRDYIGKLYPELATVKQDTSVPVAVELLGAVAKIQQILGFPKELPYPLTTYSEMNKILKDINANGWENVNVILNGWFNEGITHDWPDDIDLIRKLGRKKDFKQILDTAKKFGYNVSAKADFTFVQNDGFLDGFAPKQDASRFLSREVAEFREYSKIWYGENDEADPYYLAKPEYSLDALNSYLKDAKKLGIQSIAFNSLGNKLGANYHRKKMMSRETVLNLQVEQLQKLKDNRNVIYEGNAYALPYADIVLDFPLLSDKSSIEDGTLPFFEIALHGFVRYTGAPINITNDYITNLLKSAETGAGLYFIFMDADASELQESDFTYYFGANYDSWKDEANGLYNRFKNDFGSLTTQTIEGHEKLAENVFVTEYADGTKVYVNYRTTEYKAGKVTIPAQDWVVVKKGGN